MEKKDILKITDYTSYEKKTDNNQRWIQVTSSDGTIYEGWLEEI